MIFLFDKVENNVSEEIKKIDMVNKYNYMYTISFISLLLTIIVGSLVLFKRDVFEPPQTYLYNTTKNEYKKIITLPLPHQSLQNVTGWLYEAISASYTFDFNNIDERIENAKYYYTDVGYKLYLDSLKRGGITDAVKNQQVQVSLVFLEEPVEIGVVRTKGDAEWWKWRVPVLVNYYGGKKPIIYKYQVDIIVLRVPAYKNEKGLSITEIQMLSF